MLLGIFILFSINIYIIFFFTKWREAIFPVLMYFCFQILLFGYSLYYLKSGGLLFVYKSLIFGSSSLDKFFTNLPINYNYLAIMLSLGRLSFSLFFLLFAIQKNFNMNLFFQSRIYLYYILVGIICLCFFLSLPTTFVGFFSGNYKAQEFVVKLIDVVIDLYLVIGILFYVLEYFDIHLNYIKNRQRLLIFSQFFLAIQFLFFSRLEPIFLFQNYSSINYNLTFSPYLGVKVENFWIILMFFCLVSTVLNITQNWRYYKVYYDRNKKELIIKDKISAANVSSSILIHGLKNQLLSSEILIHDLKMQVGTGNALNLSEVEDTLGLLESNQQFIQERINILYKSFINVNTKLVPTDSISLRDVTNSKVKSKINCPNIYWKVRAGTLLCDENLLSEVISNLVCNAVEACENVLDPIIMVKILFLKRKTVISVSDNGPGLPKELQERVFQPFITTKNSLTNWGLGLCYSKMIVEKHKGSINFISKENEGTTFIITLSKYKGTL